MSRGAILMTVTLLGAGCSTPPQPVQQVCLVQLVGQTDDGRAAVVQTCKPVEIEAEK